MVVLQFAGLLHVLGTLTLWIPSPSAQPSGAGEVEYSEPVADGEDLLVGLFAAHPHLAKHFGLLVGFLQAWEASWKLMTNLDDPSFASMLRDLSEVYAGQGAYAFHANRLYGSLAGILYVAGGPGSLDEDWSEWGYNTVQRAIAVASWGLRKQLETNAFPPWAACPDGQAYNPYDKVCVSVHPLFAHFDHLEDVAKVGHCSSMAGFLQGDALHVNIRADFACENYTDTPARELACGLHQACEASGRAGSGAGAPSRRATCRGPCIIDDEYYQWIAILMAVLLELDEGDEAHLSIVELGASYGTWTARGLAAWRRLKGEGEYARTCSIVAVDNRPEAAASCVQHLADNGLQCLARHGVLLGDMGAPSPTTLSLRDVLMSLSPSSFPVSIVHMDIQHMEEDVLRAAVGDGLLRYIRMLVVGTHTRAIHLRIKALLEGERWQLKNSILPTLMSKTEYGHIAFRDGLIIAINPSPAGGFFADVGLAWAQGPPQGALGSAGPGTA